MTPGPPAPALDLGHRRDERVVQRQPVPARVDHTGDEVAADEVERGRPAADPDPVVGAQRLEPRVVAHREALVLVDVRVDVQPARGRASDGRRPSASVSR